MNIRVTLSLDFFSMIDILLHQKQGNANMANAVPKVICLVMACILPSLHLVFAVSSTAISTSSLASYCLYVFKTLLVTLFFEVIRSGTHGHTSIIPRLCSPSVMITVM